MKKVVNLFAWMLGALLLLSACSDGGGGGYSDNNGEKTPDGGSINDGSPSVITNSSIKIVKSSGWLNSAYIIFNQLDGATSYKVLCDGKKIDDELIRYYDEYVYYTSKEDSTTLQVTWTKHTLNNVVRADALGLKAGEHELKVCGVDSNGPTEDYSSATLTVVDDDRSGFCFTGSETPGAYNADGTLKDGAIVIYVTEANKGTVKATIGGTEYTGVPAITQAIKAKKTTTPVDIRLIGKFTTHEGLYCSDLNSAYAIGVKEAKFVTIEGVGDDTTMKCGVAAFKSEYIEIKNLGLMKWGGGKDGDGVSLKESKYVWVHNNDFFYGDAGSDGDQAKGDGSMDLKDDSQYVTISYNHFWDSGKMSLCGMKSESGPNYITYHHNWFDHSDSRHPRVRTMSVHVYNNYFDGNAKYGIGVTSGGNIFAEGNFFRNAHDPMMISKQGTDATGAGTFSGEKGGQIKSWNNKYEQNNTNGVKFQFVTNKFDYTNNKELGEYKEEIKTLGTENADGTWTIYDSKISDTEDKIADNSLIYVEDATVKGAYYQASKSKTAFTLSVPANTTKIIINAKTGSSASGATSTIKLKKVVDGSDESKDYLASDSIGNTEYVDIEFAISGLTEESLLEVVNGSSKNSVNIKGIKLIASSGWETKLTSGADLSNIDAYEVDSRSETIPDTVKSQSGNYIYSNFDTVLGDSGLGLKGVPSDPDKAKSDVLKFAGRHEPNYAWNFTNATDDASYAVNSALNSELNAYISSGPAMVKVQGASASSGTSGGENTGSGDDDSGSGDDDSGETGGGTMPEGTVVVKFDSFTSGATVNGVTISGNLKSGIAAKTYDGTTYTTALKIESGTSITFTLSEAKTLVLVTDTASAKLKVDGTSYTATNSIITVNLEAGNHSVAKDNGTPNLYAIILK